jgi:hypothetical protein
MTLIHVLLHHPDHTKFINLKQRIPRIILFEFFKKFIELCFTFLHPKECYIPDETKAMDWKQHLHTARQIYVLLNSIRSGIFL